MIVRRRFIALAVSTFILAACIPKPEKPRIGSPDAVYYLVRHAEKTAEKPDPALTAAGQERAQALARRLKGAPLSAVYSTNFKRTRDTAAPSALAAGLDVQLYNPGAMSEFADALLAQSGHILITGHSNTTPNLSLALGGPEGAPIDEAGEYDRLYILERTGQIVTGRIERYGK